MSIDAKPVRHLDKCPYFHRSAVIMADGEVVSCANFYAENIGRLDQNTPLSDIWNNDKMRALRSDFGTDREWAQCQNCWFREIGYAKQREEWHAQADPSLDQPAQYTEKAWSFTRFLED